MVTRCTTVHGVYAVDVLSEFRDHTCTATKFLTAKHKTAMRDIVVSKSRGRPKDNDVEQGCSQRTQGRPVKAGHCLTLDDQPQTKTGKKVGRPRNIPQPMSLTSTQPSQRRTRKRGRSTSSTTTSDSTVAPPQPKKRRRMPPTKLTSQI